jgi:hypothetical protein
VAHLEFPGERLMKKLALSFLVGGLCIAGCQSLESEKRLFIDTYNHEIGEPFYDHEKRGMKEVKISDSLSEFVPEPVPRGIAVVVWTVDTTKRGDYRHSNGMTFQIEGIKKSWRLLGDPEKARMRIRYGAG